MSLRRADPRPVGALNDWFPIGTSEPDSPHSTEAVQKHDCPSTRRICPPRLRPNSTDSNASPLGETTVFLGWTGAAALELGTAISSSADVGAINARTSNCTVQFRYTVAGWSVCSALRLLGSILAASCAVWGHRCNAASPWLFNRYTPRSVRSNQQYTLRSKIRPASGYGSKIARAGWSGLKHGGADKSLLTVSGHDWLPRRTTRRRVATAPGVPAQ
jgi:hypothetical protein